VLKLGREGRLLLLLLNFDSHCAFEQGLHVLAGSRLHTRGLGILPVKIRLLFLEHQHGLLRILSGCLHGLSRKRLMGRLACSPAQLVVGRGGGTRGGRQGVHDGAGLLDVKIELVVPPR